MTPEDAAIWLALALLACIIALAGALVVAIVRRISR